MKFTSYWLDTAPEGSPERSKTSVEGRTEVAVIGGGLTGVVAALHLARSGAKVDLFEQNTVGFGASGRNGGMATTGMSIGIRDAVAKMGFDKAAPLYRAYGQAVDLIEKLVTEEGIDCDFARPGKLILASKPAHYQGFEKTAELLNSRWEWRHSWSPRTNCVARSARTPSTAEWSTRRAPVSTWASTSGGSAKQPSAPA